jgi:hypothetical protein
MGFEAAKALERTPARHPPVDSSLALSRRDDPVEQVYMGLEWIMQEMQGWIGPDTWWQRKDMCRTVTLSDDTTGQPDAMVQRGSINCLFHSADWSCKCVLPKALTELIRSGNSTGGWDGCYPHPWFIGRDNSPFADKKMSPEFNPWWGYWCEESWNGCAYLRVRMCVASSCSTCLKSDR